MTTSSPRGPRTRFRRRVSGVLALGFGLMSCALLYTGLTPAPQVAQAQSDAALLAKGQELFNGNCVTCHGSNLQGVQEHGPSLIGVGQAAVYFQVSSGRMPMARQEAQAIRKPPLPTYDPGTEEGAANLEALGAYIQANGGGPVVPAATGDALRGNDPVKLGIDGYFFPHRLAAVSSRRRTGYFAVMYSSSSS